MMHLTSVGNYTSMLIKMLIGFVLQIFLDDIVGSDLGSFVCQNIQVQVLLVDLVLEGCSFDLHYVRFSIGSCCVSACIYMRVHLRALNNFLHFSKI